MIRCRALLLFTVMAMGCGQAEEAPPATSGADRAGPSEVEMVAAMEEHYTSAIRAHDALIQGDLEPFRAQLAELDAHTMPPDAPAAWKPFDAQLHTAARGAGAASDLATAADVLAAVTLACGSCHEAAGRGPVYPVPPVAEQEQPLRAEMREHQWATQLLWDGVTGPSIYAWKLGTEELAASRIFGDAESSDAPDEALLAYEARLRELGRRASEDASLSARSKSYGRMLETCGACHQSAGVKLPPTRSPQPGRG